MRRVLLCGCLAISALTLAVGTVLKAQQPPASGAPVRTAAQQYKNIQVLKDVPANQITQTMHLVSGELGVECQFCHIWEQFDREDKPQKQVARRMFAMMMDINKNSFGGAQVVTCYTCHRGSPKPVNMLILPVPTPPSAENPPPAPVLPSVDDILKKYVQALGGEQALRKITSRVTFAKVDIPTGRGGVVPVPADVESYQKAPNLTLNVYHTDKSILSDGFDGTAAWAQNAGGAVNPTPNPEQVRVRRRASLYEALEMKQNYTRMTVSGIELVGTRRAYVVVGYADGDSPERLYFDMQSGLLLRRAWSLPTASGASPFEMNFEDYRNAGGGVLIPFVIRMNPGSQRTEMQTSSTMRVVKVQSNVALDDSKFVKPQPRAATP